MARIEGAVRADLFAMDPEKVTIPTEGPLFDERTAWAVDEALVANIRHYGQIQPIVVRKNGGKVEVVAGRQRLKAIREINRQAKERGEKPMMVKCHLIHGNDADAYGLMISENEIRKADDPIVKAQKAKRLIQFGMSVKLIAITHGVQPRAVEEWLSLTDVAPEVQAAIQAGEIAAGVGVALAELPRDQQAAKLASMQAEAAKNGEKLTVHHARKETRNVRRSGPAPAPPPPVPSRRAIKSSLDKLCVKPIKEGSAVFGASVALQYCLGELDDAELLKLIEAA